jgi:hypothetical protein
MADFQELAIEAALRSELGRLAKFAPYGRDHRTPMTFVLEEVERQIGSCFSIYWVEDGPPEVFCLPTFSPSPVVFSTRYLSLTAFIRHLFVDDFLKNILVDVAERTTLKLMAEMALRHGDKDYSVLAFVQSVTGKGVWLNDNDQVMALEYEEKNEAYMATWFYGLVHELGHLNPKQHLFREIGIFSDAGILEAIKTALDNFPNYTDSIKQEALEWAKRHPSDSVLGVDQVRNEALADIFAASVLFKTTSEIMLKKAPNDSNKTQFEIRQFIAEMIVFLNIIAVIERCRQVASIASATSADRDVVFECLLHPVSVLVRALMLRQYLVRAVANYLFGAKPTVEQYEKVVKLFDGINKTYADTINLVDSGMARAMEFSFFPERRQNDWALLEDFRKALPESDLGLQEARRFCERADALAADSKLLRALKGIVADPTQPLRPDPIGDLVYFVPWVEGPNGFDRPFGLDTKHGHLVFLFNSQGELYDAFYEPSTQMLKPGFTLKKAAITVSRKERLGPELAAHMPKGQPFQIVIEGTSEFTQFMKELSDNSIW